MQGECAGQPALPPRPERGRPAHRPPEQSSGLRCSQSPEGGAFLGNRFTLILVDSRLFRKADRYACTLMIALRRTGRRSGSSPALLCYMPGSDLSRHRLASLDLSPRESARVRPCMTGEPAISPIRTDRPALRTPDSAPPCAHIGHSLAAGNSMRSPGSTRNISLSSTGPDWIAPGF